MKIITRIKNWIICKLGGLTREDYDADYQIVEFEAKLTEKHLETAEHSIERWEERYFELYKNFSKSQKYVVAKIPVDSTLGYTPDNVIATSKAQMCYLLGKAVYDYAEHYVINGKYTALLRVVKEIEE